MTQLNDDASPAPAETASEPEAGSKVEPLSDLFAEISSRDLDGEFFQRLALSIFSSENGVRELGKQLESWESLSFTKKTIAHTLEGYCRYLLGETDRAIEILSREKSNNPWGAYYLVRALLAAHRNDEAFAAARKVAEKFSDSVELAFILVEAASRVGEGELARETLEGISEKDTSRALYHRGYWQERCSEPRQAIESYRKALELDEQNASAAFRLGFCLDLYGDGDEKTLDEAIACYEKCLTVTPPHTNAIINLGLLYEDRERYHDAIKCFESVLRFYPNHKRARLFLEDARASTRMFYDKEEEKKADRHNQVLKIPVTDFELSVRSRNCLSKMNIVTLGDLIMKSEQELLSYKNFGETSLKEIKDMLTQKGLRLGQGLEAPGGPKADDPRNPLEASVSSDLIDRSIDTLDLSVRSRRCMERLGIQTIRDLINKTEVQLMAAKNFGMTSLNEIKRKLAELNLRLRG